MAPIVRKAFTLVKRKRKDNSDLIFAWPPYLVLNPSMQKQLLAQVLCKLSLDTVRSICSFHMLYFLCKIQLRTTASFLLYRRPPWWGWWWREAHHWLPGKAHTCGGGTRLCGDQLSLGKLLPGVSHPGRPSEGTLLCMNESKRIYKYKIHWNIFYVLNVFVWIIDTCTVYRLYMKIKPIFIWRNICTCNQYLKKKKINKLQSMNQQFQLETLVSS